MRNWHLVMVVFAILIRYISLTWDFERSSEPGSRPPTDVHEQLVHIARIEPWPIRDQKHVVVFRGWIPFRDLADGSVPVLLQLHGGPGMSGIPTLQKFGRDLLEQHFIMVYYDQRSAGKSCKYHRDDEAQLTLEQHIDDAAALIRKIQERFGVEKVYVVGGSWGSVVAANLARRYPELVHKVILRGMLVDGKQNEELSRSFVLQRLVDKVQPEDVPTPPYGSDVDALLRQRGLLTEAGGMTYECYQSGSCSRLGMQLSVAQTLLASPEFAWSDILRYRGCVRSTLRRMWPEVERYDAYESVPSLSVPLFVFHGRHDRCTAAELVEKYVDFVQAPEKHLVWFENSGHHPDLEEPERFQQLVLAAFLGEFDSIARVPGG